MRKPRRLSETQLRILRNIAAGREPATGLTTCGSGNWRHSLKALVADGLAVWPAGDDPALTEAGEKLLQVPQT